MVLGGIASRWSTKEDARRALGLAVPVAQIDRYHSESLIITTLETQGAGRYYLVVESDVMFPEDIAALEGLGRELGENWRGCILESDIWPRPHRRLAMSSRFQVHVVIPHCPPGRPKRSIFV